MPCPACSEDRALPLFEKQGFSIVRCQSCGLMYVNPRPMPEQIAALYSSVYFRSGEFDYSGVQHLEHREVKLANAELRLKLLGQYCSKGCLLDIGCGGGFFVQAAGRRGWSSMGLEPSPRAARRAAREQQVRVIAGRLEEAPVLPGRFDVVTMFDVLEHVFCPRTFLLEARKLLGPGGLVLIETPNMAGCVPRLLSHRHPWVRPPEHLTYFTPSTLCLLLERAGYRLEGLRRHAKKALTLDYVLSLTGHTNPLLSKVVNRALGWWRGLRRRRFNVPMDLLIAVAKGHPREEVDR